MAEVLEGGDDTGCDEAVPSVFPETAVGAPLTGSFAAVAVVDEDFRSWLFV